MKIKKILALWLMIISLAAAVFSSCKKDETPVPNPGEVTIELVSVTSNSAIIRGFMPVDIKICGVCWDTVGNPTVAGNHVAGEPATGSGTFSISINNLVTGRQYYAKAYSLENGNYIYSDVLPFITKQQLVNTVNASGVGLHAATLNGYVSAIGGSAWFEWGEDANSLTNKTVEQPVNNYDIQSQITGLDYHKVYFFRFANKVNGKVIYGGNCSFTTLGNKPSVGSVSINNDNLDKMIVMAMVNPNLISTSVVIEWGEAKAYSHVTASQTIEGGKAIQLTFDIPVPERALEYHFRVKTENALGVVYTEDTVSISLALIDQYGNKFHACKIGGQYWLTANWKTLSYNNGDLIPNVTDPVSWGEQTTGALCYYDNDQANYEIYGPLYNWYTVVDPRGICPPGWHVPSWNEYCALYIFLDNGSGGGNLKESGLEHWYPVNAYGTNATGFTALPGGSRAHTMSDPTPIEKGTFMSLHEQAYFWTNESCPDPTCAWKVFLMGDNGGLWIAGSGRKYYGESLRLIKD